MLTLREVPPVERDENPFPKTAALWIAFRWQSGAQCISKGPLLADARMDRTNLFLDDTENVLISVQDKVLLGVRVDMDGVTTVLR